MTTLSRRDLLVFGAAGGLTVFLASCSSASPSATTRASTAEPVTGGTATLYDTTEYSAFNVTSSAYPVSQITTNTTDRLTYQDPETGEIHPWIATSWESNDDATEYTIVLREGVTFSDGAALDAPAVKANLDQQGLGNDELGAAASGLLPGYESAEVIDDLTVVVRFSTPTVSFPAVIAWYRLGLISPNTLALSFNDQGQAQNVIGSGPFVVSSVEDNSQKITLTARDDYDWAPPVLEHQGRAYLDEIVFQYVSEASVSSNGIQSGDADVIRGVAPSQEAVLTAAGVTLVPAAILGTVRGYELRHSVPPLDDVSVRHALVIGTDTAAIVDSALSENYSAATSSLAEASPYHADQSSYSAYDPDAAKALLDDAGWAEGDDGVREKDGERLSFSIMVSTFTPGGEQILQVLQKQWEEIGVEVSITSGTATQQLAQLSDSSVPIVDTLLSGPDPSILGSLFGNAPGQNNATFADPADETLQDLIVQGAAETDDDKRKEIYAELQERVASEYDFLPVFNEAQVFAVGSRLQGFGTDAIARVSFYDAWVAD